MPRIQSHRAEVDPFIRFHYDGSHEKLRHFFVFRIDSDSLGKEDLMAESVLVTGGAGYIGSGVVSQLLEQGYQLIVYYNLSQGRLASVPANAKFIQRGISDHAALD